MKHPKLACTAGRRYRLPKLFERRGDGTRVVVVIVEADVAAVDVVDVAVVYSYRTYLLSIWNPREDRGKALLWCADCSSYRRLGLILMIFYSAQQFPFVILFKLKFQKNRNVILEKL